ncbi:hypothetical protein VN97_g2980 [Penicillium thymicola]|uniref:Uncharacterized protein n=1 Tax=Penicillium thymicola TaxID=293382 RepID=A0AAI9TN38_PENTH|nr:hypothetical protein VN97_g2980 [Penicillium thymicola]
MPAENTNSDLVQPWREWYTALMGTTPKGEAITMKDDVDAGMNPAKYGMSQHGTIALDPRADVDFSKEKPKPSRSLKK